MVRRSRSKHLLSLVRYCRINFTSKASEYNNRSVLYFHALGRCGYTGCQSRQSVETDEISFATLKAEVEQCVLDIVVVAIVQVLILAFVDSRQSSPMQKGIKKHTIDSGYGLWIGGSERPAGRRGRSNSMRRFWGTIIQLSGLCTSTEYGGDKARRSSDRDKF